MFLYFYGSEKKTNEENSAAIDFDVHSHYTARPKTTH